MKIARIVIVLLLGIILVSGLACGLLDSTTVRVFQGVSMEPTIYSGQRCTIDKNAYTKAGPVRGDIVLFDFPQDPGRKLIKRVIALPGEEVEIKDGQVYITDINDDTFLLPEPYINEEPNYTYGPQVVPEDEYFVLGDNRNHSTDSHMWGMLPGENIIGKVLHCE